LRFFFDNCLSRNLAQAISALSIAEDYDVIHLQERFPADTPDVEWIRTLGQEGDWIVISGDPRISRNRHEREVWRQAQLTTFFLAKGWMNQKIWDQAVILVRWWPRIVEQAKFVQPGAVFEIPIRFGSGKFKQP
jgi:PIN like domain